MAADEDLGFRVVAMESFAVDEDIPPIQDRTSTELEFDPGFRRRLIVQRFLGRSLFLCSRRGFWYFGLGFDDWFWCRLGGWLRDGVGCHSNRIFLRLSDPGWGGLSLLRCGSTHWLGA